MPEKITIETPENFNFKVTVRSHGWSDLPPFYLDEENGRLKYVFSNEYLKQPVSAIIYETENNLTIEISGEKNNQKAREKILRDVRHILRLDENFEEFYRKTKKVKALGWIERKNAGRLLRSPTVFEDLIKTVCTTNCSWSLTKKMVMNLVEKLGEPSKTGENAFPTPEAMAKVSPDFYRKEIRAGYRSPYFAEIAEQVASGQINPESWLNSDLSTRELKREMKHLKGVGDYAAENLLKLVGRYEGLALDSWLRAQFYKKHNADKSCVDKQIEQFYDSFGNWRGLAIWCDMTERWHG